MYEYNERNWLKKVIATVKKGSTEREVDLRYYTYNRYGNVKVIRDCQDFLQGEDNYFVKSFTYDVYNRVSEISTANEGSSEYLQVDEYTYDKNGNILTKMEVRSGEETTTSYIYDSQNRLVSSKQTKGDVVKSCSYEYDLTGNRTKVTVDGKETVSTYNGLNQLTSQTVDGVTTNFTYDGAGNQIKEMCGENAKSYEYDVKNRLTKVTATTGSATKVLQENAYNGDGQRIRKVENGSETVYYYQNGSLYQTMDQAENVTAMYLYGSAGNAIAVEDFTEEEVEAYTYVKDAQGSTCQLTDESGEAVTNYEYDDYGVTSRTGEVTVNVLAYTGGVYDEEIGQYYLNARYYDPEQGMFLTQDTYRGEQNQPATWNLYGYCGGNPVNYVDPSGHYREKIKVKNKTVTLIVKKNKTNKEKTEYAKALYEISKKYFNNIVRRKVMVAQSCAETGYGTSDNAVKNKNLFGIKMRGTLGKTYKGFAINKKLKDSTWQYAYNMKKSNYYSAARKVIKKYPNNIKKYINAIAVNYCESPDDYVTFLNSILKSLKNRKVW